MVFFSKTWLADSFFRKTCVCGASMALLGFCPLPLATAHAFATEAVQASFTIRPPSGFVDSVSIAEDLFRDTQSDLNGVLLKLYLPSADALLYEENRRDSITRQVAIYVWPQSEQLVMDKKTLELVAKTQEGAYVGYETIPPEKLPGLRKDEAQMQEAYRAVLVAGASLLVETRRDDQSFTFSALVNYALTPPRPVNSPIFTPANSKAAPKKNVPPAPEPPAVIAQGLVTAIATTLVLVDSSIVFITASSLIIAPQPENVGEHLEWAANTSESFADMLVSSNKK